MKESLLEYLFLIFGAVFVLFLALLVGCDRTRVYQANKPPVTPVDPIKPPTGNAITFKQVNANTIAPFCLRCHTGGPTDLTSYANVMRFVSVNNSKGSKMCDVVTTGKMPIGAKLPDAHIKELCLWIDSGAKES